MHFIFRYEVFWKMTDSLKCAMLLTCKCHVSQFSIEETLKKLLQGFFLTFDYRNLIITADFNDMVKKREIRFLNENFQLRVLCGFRKA